MIKLLQCTTCGSRLQRSLNDFEEIAIARDGQIASFCRECVTATRWRAVGHQAESARPFQPTLLDGVLLIGNDDSVLQAIKGVLENCGAEVEIARSFDESIMRILRRDFDLIVSEHRPPDFDAARLVNFIKSYRPDCVDQVCFVTNQNTAPEDLKPLMQSGAVNWSAKQDQLLRSLGLADTTS